MRPSAWTAMRSKRPVAGPAKHSCIAAKIRLPHSLPMAATDNAYQVAFEWAELEGAQVLEDEAR